MGKASSAKKVARAARSGGKAKGQRRNLGFPAAVGVLVLLGVGLVAFARSTNPGGGPPTLDDHWHAAYGVYVCDRWVTNLGDYGPDRLGIHTHQDGLIHIHPFISGAAGEGATLKKFFEQVGLDVSDSSVTMPPGQLEERRYKEGESTCGDEDAQWQLAYWPSALEATGDPEWVRTSGFGGVRLDTNLAAYTLAFVPAGAEIPPPPSASDILARAVVDGPEGAPVQGAPDNSERPESTEPADPGDDEGDPGTSTSTPDEDPPDAPATDGEGEQGTG